MKDLIPEADPDIDIKRVGPMLERINTLDKFVDAFKRELSTGHQIGNNSVFRSVKNFVLILHYCKLNEVDRNALRAWADSNKDIESEKRTRLVVKNVSPKITSNYENQYPTD